MSISVGGIDLASGVLDAQYRIAVLEMVVERLLKFAPPGAITESDLKSFQDRAFENMQKRYPQAGIERKPGAA
jgi:hypothetical protein